jgi:hypothetical protein
MAKKTKTTTKAPSTELAALRAERKEARQMTKALASELNKTGEIVEKGRKQLTRIIADVGDQNSTSRAAVVGVSATVIAQGLNEMLGLAARALGEWSQRSEGREGHFAKHIGIYQSMPQSLIGAAVWMIELFTRSKRQMTLSLGRDITNRASFLLINLGTANMLRAIRYHLANSVDEQQEFEAEKSALMNKIAELQKQIEGKK